MLVGGVVRHEIENDPQAARVRGLKECVEVGERAEKRVDGAIVADVIPKVPHRRGKDGGNPNCIYPEADQVLKPLRYPLEIADTIRIRVAGTTVGILGRSPPFATKRYLSLSLQHSAPFGSDPLAAQPMTRQRPVSSSMVMR